MSTIKRLSKIAKVAAQYRLDTLLDAERMPKGLGFLLAIGPWHLFKQPKLTRGERLRLSLEALGPIFIKFGQMLSTRRDLLPDDIADELAKLQDQVPPFSQQQSIDIIEQSLGQSVEQIFLDFTPQPMASASVAQVHAATLHSGEDVVIKVLRPGIEKIIRQDIKLLFILARLIEKYFADGPRLRPVEVVEDYQHTIIDELDLMREGANTSQLKRNFEHSDLLYVPEVFWDYTRRDVLTVERIYGIPVTDVAALEQQQTNMKSLAERGVEIFFTQVFRDSFFHADMHPGNVFVSREHPDRPQYIAIDCAIIGTLSESDQYYLARNLLAIFQRDYRLVAELHIECGWIPSNTRASDFESAIRTVCEPIFEKPLGEISFGQLLVYLFQTARRFEMEVQPSLVLLQKTLLNIEGLGRQLYPPLDLWTTAQPFLEEWIKNRYSPKESYKRARRHLPALLEQLPKLPEMLVKSISTQSHSSGPLKDQQLKRLELLEQKLKLSATNKPKYQTILSVILLVAAILSSNPNWQEQIGNIPTNSWLLGVFALLLWIKR